MCLCWPNPHLQLESLPSQTTFPQTPIATCVRQMTHCLRISEQISIPTSEQFVQELDMEPRWYELGLFLGLPSSFIKLRRKPQIPKSCSASCRKAARWESKSSISLAIMTRCFITPQLIIVVLIAFLNADNIIIYIIMYIYIWCASWDSSSALHNYMPCAKALADYRLINIFIYIIYIYTI